YIKHNQNAKSYLGTHYINIKKNTIISNILGEKALVNTYHHQSVKDLGQGLEVSAYSNDGIIEAIEKKDASFVVGVQWHPEMMAEYNGNMLNIFKYFIKKC
ncbi:MAG: gamma-glutamyl-gamma-aminobutyrate hydrolase family protein, partial [Paraclostridium sp.]